MARAECLHKISNPRSRILRVEVEVVGVCLDGIGAQSGSANQVVVLTVRSQSTGIRVQGLYLFICTHATFTLAGRAIKNVVGLIWHVVRVAEEQCSGNVATCTRRLLQAGESATAASCQNVADDVRTLAVAAQHKCCVGTFGIVCVDLRKAVSLGGKH